MILRLIIRWMPRIKLTLKFMDNETYQSLRKVIEYLWVDEHRHWNEAGNPEDHIFKDVLRLQNWSEEVAKDYVNL